MIEFRIKEKTKSLNRSFRGTWHARAGVAKRQRKKAMQACPEWPGGPLLVVRLTRVSPGTLDGDAVPAACKHIRDGVAARLKIDDASPLVEWEYHQAKGEAEVVVQIWKVGEVDPSLPVVRPVERKRGKVLATVTSDAGKRLRVVRDPGKGQRRAPRHKDAPVAPLSLTRALNAMPGFSPPPEKHGEDAEFNTALQRRLGSKAARKAEETFAPAPLVHFRCASGACTCGAAPLENCG